MIAIPNIDKPKGCGKCEVWSLCHYPKVDKGYDDKVMPDCPLIEIPTPHGRLIDADEFKATLMKQLEMAKANYQGDKYERIKEIMEFIFNNLYKDIDNAPTMLEAET